MIIRCDGISGISPGSMTDLPALLQPIATVCRRESRIRSTTALAGLIASPAGDRPAPLGGARRALRRAFNGSHTQRSQRLTVLLRNGALRPRI